MRPIRSRRGFSLVELLVALGVIHVLVPRYAPVSPEQIA